MRQRIRCRRGHAVEVPSGPDIGHSGYQTIYRTEHQMISGHIHCIAFVLFRSLAFDLGAEKAADAAGAVGGGSEKSSLASLSDAALFTEPSVSCVRVIFHTSSRKHGAGSIWSDRE